VRLSDVRFAGLVGFRAVRYRRQTATLRHSGGRNHGNKAVVQAPGACGDVQPVKVSFGSVRPKGRRYGAMAPFIRISKWGATILVQGVDVGALQDQ